MSLNLEKIRREIEGASDDARYNAWLDLYTSEDKEAKEELDRVTHSQDPILKVFFLRFLGHVDQIRAILYIIDLLQDSNEVVRDAAKKSFDRNLCNLKLKRLIPLIHSSCKPAKYFAIERLSQGGESSVLNDLLRMLDGADEDLLLRLLTAFRFLSDRNIISYIVPYLEDARENVRFKTILVLGAIFEYGYFPVKQTLIAALKDPVPNIRRAILWSLRTYATQKDIPLLMQISLKDADPTVRQESLIELGSFPIPKVIQHLLKVMVFETDRLLILKAEGILLSFPPDLLVKGLQGLLYKGNIRLRNKAMLLFAQFEKNSKPYFQYLIRGLQSAKTDKEKLPFVEALGMVEAKEGIPLLEKEVHGSYLIAYAAMISLIKIWRVIPDPPVLQYLKDPLLHPLLRQMVLKYLVRKGTKKLFTDEMIALLISFLEEDNTNVRYLSAQALVLSGQESTIQPLFEMILRETDPTSLKFLEENVVRLLIRNPFLFPELLAKTLDKPHAVEILFDMIRQGNIPSAQLLVLMPSILKKPLTLMQTRYKDLCADFISFSIISREVTLEQVLTAVADCPDKNHLLAELVKRFEENPSFRFFLSGGKIQEWLATSDPLQKKAMVELLGQAEGDAPIGPLVSIVCDPALKTLHKSASHSLNRVLRISS